MMQPFFLQVIITSGTSVVLTETLAIEPQQRQGFRVTLELVSVVVIGLIFFETVIFVGIYKALWHTLLLL